MKNNAHCIREQCYADRSRSILARQSICSLRGATRDSRADTRDSRAEPREIIAKSSPREIIARSLASENK